MSSNQKGIFQMKETVETVHNHFLLSSIHDLSRGLSTNPDRTGYKNT